jgi:hypothetical protein
MLDLSSKGRINQEVYFKNFKSFTKTAGRYQLSPSLKLTTDTLSPLFQLLKGDPNPSSL